MAIDLDDEILQDFLVEAGEILELLSEQLVALEQSPEDYELLNAIFRGFHTVKGGAGFLAIDPLVEICHKAEDVFNLLRQGERRVTPALMDVILQVVDVVNQMFAQIRSGRDPEPADVALIASLQRLANGDAAVSALPPSAPRPEAPVVLAPPPPIAEVEAEAEEEAAEMATGDALDIVEQQFEAMLSGDDALGMEGDEISEQEFEHLLDTLQESANVSRTPQPPPANATQEAHKSSPADEITEEEFEALLDQLHGPGKFNPVTPSPVPASPPSVAAITAASDEITEQEFEALLDQLHGPGRFDPQKISDKLATPAPTAAPSPSPIPTPPIPTPAAKPPVDKVHRASGDDASAPKPSAAIPVSAKADDAKWDKDDEAAAKGARGAAAAAQPAAETTVRVDTQILDNIMNMVGELVLVRNRFQTLKLSTNDEQIAKAIANLDVVTADLQLAVMKTRMQPIKKVFGRFPRVVRDLARSLKKEINLELRGEETDLDKNLVEALADPLVHLVRNAVDHGIEDPETRLQAGKPREGRVILTASQEGDHIELTIEDDGKGMDPNFLRRKVVEKGLMDEETAARLDDRECFNLIFMPGFSTKSEISDISGRGVGMDVVKTRIVQMNGTVEVTSKPGMGTVITIKVPLTLAIMPTLMVRLGAQAFALPLASVLEILNLDLGRTNVVDGQLCVIVRKKALPLFYLSDWLVRDPNYVSKREGQGHVVVVNAGGRQIGFVVDQLIGQEEVVIKALGAKLHGLDGLAGATITGDGKIALILDVPGLVKKYAA